MKWVVYFLLLCPLSSAASMTLHIANAPQLTPLLDTIYLAGNFNNWNPSDVNYICWPDATGWTIEINAAPNTLIECKFTRGTWGTVEGDQAGAYIDNRQFTYLDNGTIELQIEGWEDLPGAHTLSPQVRILDSNFYIPQLNRTRRIWLRWPASITSQNAAYPVCYFLDGQNTMDQATSFAGEWNVDEALDEFAELNCSEALVVAIDNGGSHRMDEYSPWYNAEYDAGGEGDELALFIANTLKPYIDQHYPTQTDAQHTTIIGSSLGALLATYVMCTFPNQFGQGGMFSPAYWFNPEIFQYAELHPLTVDSRVYFVSGTTESTDMVPDMENMQAALIAAGNSPSTLLITHTDGAHSEWYWRREFPAAYLWLSQCAESTVSTITQSRVDKTQLFPNPVVDTLTIETTRPEKLLFFIYDDQGKALHTGLLEKKITLPMTSYTAGQYTFVLRSTDGTLVYQDKIVKL